VILHTGRSEVNIVKGPTRGGTAADFYAWHEHRSLTMLVPEAGGGRDGR
jgi:hypothetical protein